MPVDEQEERMMMMRKTVPSVRGKMFSSDGPTPSQSAADGLVQHGILVAAGLVQHGILVAERRQSPRGVFGFSSLVFAFVAR